MLNVIIPILNQPFYTSCCLDSLLFPVQNPVRYILVNNGSTLKTSNLISSWISNKAPHLNVQHIILPNNCGFAGAVNQGIKVIKDFKNEDLILILHNDTILFENCINEMISLINSDEDVAAVIPRTNCAIENTPTIEELRDRFLTIKPSNKQRVSSEEIIKVLNTLIPDKKQFLQNLKTLYPLSSSYSPEISSFCMLTKGFFFNKYGLLDESFYPRFWEDRWWWLPIERDGFIALIANHAFCFHHQGATSDQIGFCLPEIFKINEERFLMMRREKDTQMGDVIKVKKNTNENTKIV